MARDPDVDLEQLAARGRHAVLDAEKRQRAEAETSAIALGEESLDRIKYALGKHHHRRHAMVGLVATAVSICAAALVYLTATHARRIFDQIYPLAISMVIIVVFVTQWDGQYSEDVAWTAPVDGS